MDKKTVERHAHVIGHLRTIVAIWFFAGMPLSMVLSGLAFVAGVPLPPLLFFLTSLVYLSGGLLGGIWCGESLRRRDLSGPHLGGSLFILVASIGFLYLAIIFAVMGFRHL
jgi:hypothetical protein